MEIFYLASCFVFTYDMLLFFLLKCIWRKYLEILIWQSLFLSDRLGAFAGMFDYFMQLSMADTILYHNSHAVKSPIL